MEDRLNRCPADRKWVRSLSLYFAVIVCLVLLVAAYGKFFHPKESLVVLDRWVSVFEILFALAVFLFRRKWALWLSAAVVFGSWFGYALYWYLLKLPCNCMGDLVHIPTLFSLTLDSLFFVFSLLFSRVLGARKDAVYLTVLIAAFGGLVGYAFAEWVYHTLLLKI